MRGNVVSERTSRDQWPDPKSIPGDLPRVGAFALDLLPDQLAPWIDDIANHRDDGARGHSRPQNRD